MLDAVRMWLTILAAVFLIASAAAHPGTGIVRRDVSGDVYYTDLAQVWRISPQGERTVFVGGVHTHELAIDAEGRLYGEHLWYEGEATNKWGHFVWRATPAGRVEKIVPPTEGFLRDYGFARDRAGNVYWVQRELSGGPAVRKRTADGKIATIAQKPSWLDVRWWTVAPNGTVYLIDRTNLVRITPDGRATVLALNLAETRDSDKRHQVMGLCADDAGVVYVAVPGKRVVKRVDADGRVTIAARCSLWWLPSGVLAAPDGLWILEYNRLNAVRVRHVRHDGTEQIFGPDS